MGSASIGISETCGWFIGPVPKDGLDVYHNCGNRAYIGKVNHKQSKETGVDSTDKTALPSTVIIQTAPTFGNIKERALTLSQEILDDLYKHGWKYPPWSTFAPSPWPPSIMEEMPTTPKEYGEWKDRRSWIFRGRFLPRVLEIRNEFAQLHMRYQDLDDSLKWCGVVEQADKMAVGTTIQSERRLLPMEIQQIADRLVVLANQVK